MSESFLINDVLVRKVKIANFLRARKPLKNDDCSHIQDPVNKIKIIRKKNIPRVHHVTFDLQQLGCDLLTVTEQ